MHYKKAPRLRGAQRLSTWRFCAASAPCGATSLHCGWHVPRDKEQTAGGSNLRNPGTSVAIPSRGILAERSSPSRVRFAAPNSGAPLTAAGRSAHLSAKKEWGSPEWRRLLQRSWPWAGSRNGQVPKAGAQDN